VQYIVKAKKIPLPSPSIVSTIIIPVLNNLGLTKNCINSIRENTAAPYRLVVVDNGSTDGTRAWLKQQPDILHILNSTNLGFGPAINEGFFCSKTPTFIVLNNDTLVAKNWLTNMLAHLSHDPSVGIVGPMSNFVSGPQLLPDSDRLSPDSFFSHAASVFSERQGLSKVVGRLVFFCALIKKDVVDKIGGIDERFIIGNFEDDDFCRRALSAGFKCLIAQDTLVYHFGHATFKANNIDLNKLLAVNRKTYNSKWEAPK
jgi:GT2 family glycosyltransferase